MEIAFDIWSIIFLIAAAQGMFLSILLYTKKSKANYLLASLTFLFTLCLLYYVSFWTGLDNQLPFFFSIVLGFTYLIGPLLLFYIKSGASGSTLDIRHFIPFCLYVIFYLTYWLIPDNQKPTALTVQVIVQNIHLMAYVIVIYRWIKSNKDLKGDTSKLNKWRLQIFWAFAGYVFSFLSYYILVWTSVLKVEYDYMISLTSAFFIYFVGYKGFTNPALINQYSKAKYEKSTLSDSASRAVLDKIKYQVEEKKLYLDSELKLKTLSEKLSLSTHHISQVLNQVEGKSFSDFINEYRLEEAKMILSDPDKKELRLIDVAYDTGFNNKTSFNNAFKKITGMSPSQYRLENLDKVLS
ncbi:MAG: helix-turn-helix domain-containing protein [Bacteroidota bacterium]